MRGAFLILIWVSLASVATVLGFGVYALFRGGSFGRTWSNRLMRLRVLLQLIAIIIIVSAAVLLRHGQ